MLKTAFLIFVRNLKAAKTFTIVNIIGLGLGVCFSGLIYLFLKNENSFDQFHEQKERIFRLESNVYDEELTGDDKFRGFPELSDPLIGAIRAQIPEITHSTRYFTSYTEGVLRYKREAFAERITYVDNDFFKMFSFPVLKGNLNKPFENTLSAVLTKSIANKLFKNEDPIGKTISVDSNGEKLYLVSAVVDDPPLNSSIDFEILVPVESWAYYNDYTTLWNEYSYSFFVLARDGVEEHILRDKLNLLVGSVMKDHIAKLRDIFAVPGTVEVVYYLSSTRLPLVHWNTRIPWDGTTSVRNVWTLSTIAAIIILISSINFVSVALTRSTARSKEVGVRKINGAGRRQLIIQFVLESLAHTLIASLLGLVLMIFLSMNFNSFIGKQIPYDISFLDILAFISLIILITILNSLYPALLISSFSPATILKSHFNHKIKTGLVSGLVIFQFSISVFLAVCAVVMLKQMKFINSKDLGFEKAHVISIPTYASRVEAEAIVARVKEEILRQPGVISVAGVSRSFFKGISSMGYLNSRRENNSAKVYSVDADYIKTLGLTLVDGRNFDEDRKTDQLAVIVNESLARDIPLNRYLKWGGRPDSAEVIGVVRDFHFRSLERPIEPLFLTMNYAGAGPRQTVLVRFSGDIETQIAGLKKIWDGANPGRPFEVSFLEDDVAKQYESYQRWNNVISLATTFAVLIASVGLFGLAGINTVRRYHELGIRKTLGATSADLIVLLNLRYIIFVCIAFIVAAPFSYFMMTNWLNNFVFRISLDWVIYAEIFFVSCLVALITVSYHTLKATTIDPAKTLRYE